MKAIILAAGRGSRMGSLTGNAPKCLTQLAERTLLDWQISALRQAGISTIGVVRGYLGEQLERPGITYFNNPRWQSTNMVRSLECARSWLESGPVLVSYSDIVYSAQTVQALAASPHSLAIAFDPQWLALWSKRFADPLSDAETFLRHADGTLKEIGSKTTERDRIQGQYMGLLKFTPEGWKSFADYLRELPSERVDRLDMTSTLQALIQRRVAIHTVALTGGWYEVDTESDLRLYQKEIEEGTSWLKKA